MTYVNPDYNPSKKNKKILDAAWSHIQSVPYKVSSRWLFYCLLQDGLYSTKGDYRKKWVALSSTARKSFYKGWRPNTLTDDTRTATVRGDGFFTPQDWARALGKYGITCSLSHWPQQKQYIELWFEANAMWTQFAYYTERITLRPFGGKPSIPYKWEMAKALEDAYETYGLPIVILYFGDLDEHGLSIPKNAISDVRDWCDVDFDVVRCGLNPGHEVKYNIPENYKHPGAYQWEALSDEGAKELITSSVAQYVDFSVLTGKVSQEARARAQFLPIGKVFADNQVYTRGKIPV